MQPFAAISLLFAVLVAAHGGHDDHAGENPKLAGVDYAIRHVRPRPISGPYLLLTFFIPTRWLLNTTCVYSISIFCLCECEAQRTCLDTQRFVRPGQFLPAARPEPVRPCTQPVFLHACADVIWLAETAYGTAKKLRPFTASTTFTRKRNPRYGSSRVIGIPTHLKPCRTKLNTRKKRTMSWKQS